MTTELKSVSIVIYKCEDCPHFYDGGIVGEDWCMNGDSLEAGYIEDRTKILPACPYRPKEGNE